MEFCLDFGYIEVLYPLFISNLAAFTNTSIPKVDSQNFHSENHLLVTQRVHFKKWKPNPNAKVSISSCVLACRLFPKSGFLKMKISGSFHRHGGPSTKRNHALFSSRSALEFHLSTHEEMKKCHVLPRQLTVSDVSFSQRAQQSNQAASRKTCSKKSKIQLSLREPLYIQSVDLVMGPKVFDIVIFRFCIVL